MSHADLMVEHVPARSDSPRRASARRRPRPRRARSGQERRPRRARQAGRDANPTVAQMPGERGTQGPATTRI